MDQSLIEKSTMKLSRLADNFFQVIDKIRNICHTCSHKDHVLKEYADVFALVNHTI